MIGPNRAATFAVPRDCTANKNEQDDHSQRHDIFVKRRRRDIDAFDGGQHRQGRRDHGIAIEQRGADNAEERDDADGLADTADGARSERHQGQRAALAVIVGAQQDDDVFERDDDEQRPKNERHHAKHRGAVELGMLAARDAAMMASRKA